MTCEKQMQALKKRTHRFPVSALGTGNYLSGNPAQTQLPKLHRYSTFAGLFAQLSPDKMKAVPGREPREKEETAEDRKGDERDAGNERRESTSG